MEKSYRELHGEYLLGKIQADEASEALTKSLIDRINNLFNLVSGDRNDIEELKKQNEANIRSYRAIIYKAGYTDGVMDTIAKKII